MAEDAIVEPEATEEPVTDAPESVDTPEPVSETVTEVQASADTPETAGGEPEGETVVTEPDEPEPITIEALKSMSPKDRLALVREQVPELASDLEYAGAESREAKLRREAGSRERIAEQLKGIKAKLAEIPEDDDAGLGFMWDNAFENARSSHLASMAEQWGQLFEPTADERDRLTKAATTGDVNVYAATMLDAAARHLGSRSVYEQSVDDIPADTPLAKSIQAREQAKVEAELKAAQIEAREPREPAPVTPTGSPVGTVEGDPLLTKLEQYGSKALTDEERAQAFQRLGLKQPAR